MPGTTPMYDVPGLVLSPSDFVTLLNQTLEYAYPGVTIEGELSNLRVSKGKWVYFDLKDETASIKCFGTVYQLPGPLEEGWKVQVRAVPRLHPQFGFSLTVQSIQPVGEGALKRAFELLQAKLQAEGLFEAERKRIIPYPPRRIGLVTSSESAAYADFVKIINERWGGLEIYVADVQVQGEAAPAQIVAAIEYFSAAEFMPDVVVVTRGGGSADDLYAFNTEQVVRAVAASRVPTLVAIGHEIDISLAELAADQRASTPSNAAQLLVPERGERLRELAAWRRDLTGYAEAALSQSGLRVSDARATLDGLLDEQLETARNTMQQRRLLLQAYDPYAVLRRGYALVRAEGTGTVTRAGDLRAGQNIELGFSDGKATAKVSRVIRYNKGERKQGSGKE